MLTPRAGKRASLGTAVAGAFCALITPTRSAHADARIESTSCCPIVELRQYTLHPGRLDGFVQLFEQEFIEPQEAAGMRVIGQFRDLDDPDRFVWLRGFSDMASRARALEAFYGGPVWKARRELANANFIDTDNVLLLHPLDARSGFALDLLQRAPQGATPGDRGVVVVTVYALKPSSAAAFGGYFRDAMLPVLVRAGFVAVAQLETDTAANTFPRLPVRSGEFVFVWVARFPDRASSDAAQMRLADSAQWRDAIAPELERRLGGSTQVLRLTPTARALWPGGAGP